MASNTTRANLMQTAVNAAATLTSAYIQSGFVVTLEEAREAFERERENIFQVLSSQQEEAQAEASSRSQSAPAPATSAGGRITRITVDEARNTPVRYGKFAGLKLGEIFDMPASKAAEYGYGEGDKSGKDYVKWLSGNNQNPFLQRRAQVLLDAAS